MPPNRRFQPSRPFTTVSSRTDYNFCIRRQLEVGGLICHVDLYAIRPTPYPHLRAVGNSGEGSSGAPTFEQPTLVAPMPPSEESKVTDSLFGTTFAHASQIKGLDGDEVIFYVFSVLLMSPSFDALSLTSAT
jgi:hypothetical protein